jgi:hypothetical protein
MVMLQFTIRELLILTLSAGLAVGWWLDHRQHAGAFDDAKYLAQLTMDCENGCRCWESKHCWALRKKYGATVFDWSKWDELTAKMAKNRNAVHP